MKKTVLFILSLLSVFVLVSCSSYDYGGNYQPNYEGGLLEDTSGETYEEIIENEFIATSEMPVSTFSADVDTASYSNVRRMLNDGFLPYADSVRIEEMINYFDHDLDRPTEGEDIHVTKELSVAPWNEEHQLLMLGLKTEDIVYDESKPMNLVFLIDVSGSMGSDDKLPLLKQAMRLLVEQLKPDDVISIVVYAGAAGVVLDGGDQSNVDEIYDAINHLKSGGSTAGGEGIELAYEIAQDHFITGGNNRILLASDGDFNVGISSVDALEDLISEKRDTGVFFSVLGFGTGNLRDDVMETLADNGNGAYYYIDSEQEAEKVLVHDLSANMITVAKDVKLQVEFNPKSIKGYRLLGYENRVLNYQDFEDDDKDAGDMGAGHEVIAFYEIIPAGSDEEINLTEQIFDEETRYDGENYLDEYANLSIRYKDPDSSESVLQEVQVMTEEFTTSPSETFRFASAVVEFGLLLRGSAYKYNASYDRILSRASFALGDDTYGYRTEFMNLVRIAKNLSENLDD